MNVPNFASRPFLNARPVWLLTAAALLFTVVLGFVNVRIYLEGNQVLATQLEVRDQLMAQQATLQREVSGQIDELSRVPWRSLANRVRLLNGVLNEHNFSWLELLDDLERTLPYGVRVVSIAPELSEDRVTLNIKAVARTRESLLEFIDKLIEDPSFTEPLPQREDWPESAQVVGYAFTINVVYLADGGAP